jgi:hypothetical protein
MEQFAFLTIKFPTGKEVLPPSRSVSPWEKEVLDILNRTQKPATYRLWLV